MNRLWPYTLSIAGRRGISFYGEAFLERLHRSLWVLMSPPPAEFSQLIETGSTLSDVNQYGSGMDGFRFGRQFLQGEVSRTVDALGIGIVLMHDPVERIKEFVLQIH